VPTLKIFDEDVNKFAFKNPV